ncbi:MAG: ribonuclease HII [Akkermansia sp.]
MWPGWMKPAAALWPARGSRRRYFACSGGGVNRFERFQAVDRSKRERLFLALLECEQAVCSVGVASVEEIDRFNILRATHLAMARAVEGLALRADFCLVDGLPVKGLPVPHRAIVKGDGRSLSIAAASVLAKVTRDRMMTEADASYPQYGFAKHKGYGTKAHMEALRRHGPCPLHRRSFAPVSQMELSIPE